MKARRCADERPKHEYISKEESLSPTVSIYALFGLCVIDALDKQSVITIGIPGAFLQGIWPQDQHLRYLKFEGVMVNMLCQIQRSYQEYIIY